MQKTNYSKSYRFTLIELLVKRSHLCCNCADVTKKPAHGQVKLFSFTLIELLVVIAIIATLAAMLLPALSKVKETSRRSQCGSNIAQVGKTMSLYAHDFGGHMPRSDKIMNEHGNGNEAYWMDRIARDYKVPKYGIYNDKIPLTGSVFYCPSHDPTQFKAQYLKISYGTNDFATGYAPMGYKQGDTWLWRNWTPHGSEKFPSKQNLLAEACGQSEFSTTNLWVSDVYDKNKISALHFRHEKKMNLLFLDLHGEVRNAKGVPCIEGYGELATFARTRNTYFMRGEKPLYGASDTIVGL